VPIAAGGKVMEAEVLRVVPPLLEDGGGLFPVVTTVSPPIISWPNYVDYSRLLGQLCGWL